MKKRSVINLIRYHAENNNAAIRNEAYDIARDFAECGFHILATGRTQKLLVENGIEAEYVNKLQEGRPNILDLITNGKIDMVVNTPGGKESGWDDSYLRKGAIRKKVPYMTTMAAARATASGIKAIKKRGSSEVRSLQELHAMIHDK